MAKNNIFTRLFGRRSQSKTTSTSGGFFGRRSQSKTTSTSGGFFGRRSQSETTSTSNSFLGRIFGRFFGSKTAPKKADDFIQHEISDKERQNRQKYESFNMNNPDMNISADEWETMVTTLGTMGDTIEKFGYEAYKQLIQDMHDENIQLSKSDMAYVINESLSIMRNSDRAFTQEDAMDLLRERIFNY